MVRHCEPCWGEAIPAWASRQVLKIGIMEGQYYVYIITNKNDTVLYTGVTNNLYRRIKRESKQQKRYTYSCRIINCLRFVVPGLWFVIASPAGAKQSLLGQVGRY